MLTGLAENGRKLTINEILEIFQSYDLFEKDINRKTTTRFRVDETRSLLEQVQDWIVRSEMPSEDRWKLLLVLRCEIEQKYGADSDQLAYPGFDAAEDFQGRHLMISEGFDRLIDYWKEGVEIRTAVRVDAIDYSTPEVIVQTDQGLIRASRVLVTVPLGVLQKGSIRFTPDLPMTKQSAIDRLGMGLQNKVFLRFDKPFWPVNQQVFFFAWENASWPECYNLQPVIGQPVLMAISSGRRAAADEAHSDEVIVAGLMKQLQQTFADKVTEPLASRVTRWGSDPFAFGSNPFL